MRRVRLGSWAAALQSSCAGCNLEQLGRALGVINTWLPAPGAQSAARQLHCQVHHGACSADTSVCSRLAAVNNSSSSFGCGLASWSSSTNAKAVQQHGRPSASAAVAAVEAAAAPRELDQATTADAGTAAAAGSSPGKKRSKSRWKRGKSGKASDDSSSSSSCSSSQGSSLLDAITASEAGGGSSASSSSSSIVSIVSSSSSSSSSNESSTTAYGAIASEAGNSRSDGSSASSEAAITTAAGQEVAVEFHPLPSCALDDEEQQSLDKAVAVINKLAEGGFMGLIVGGWVRDRFLGRRASDLDIATNATPNQLRRLFPGLVELPRGTVKLSQQGEVMELTCFRGISRAASLFSVAMDAARRDFTVNALYYDPLADRVIDCLGGVGDAAARTLRLTPDPAARLREDPLRLLRAVRFATLLGLRLAPETAAALREHAHLCAVAQGLPARRIWLELRKLHRAEQQQPGAWPRALKLCFHLGLLPALLPWLSGNAAAAQQAVLVAERLSRLWAGQQPAVPLGLLVAATVPPSHHDLAGAAQQVRQYFSDPLELAAIDMLIQAAQLAQQSRSGGAATAASSSSSADGWVQVYAAELSPACLQVLAAWMPQMLADSFTRHHQTCRLQLAERIASHKQQLYAQQEQQSHDSARSTAGVHCEAGAAAGTRRRRQQEELHAAIQALLGEQQQVQVETEEGVMNA